MNQPNEQQLNKSFKMDTIEFNNKQEYQDYVKKSQQDMIGMKNLEKPNTIGIAKDKFKIQQIELEQGYQQYIEEEYKKLALPQDQKLEELKLHHIDIEIKDSNKQQLMNSEKQKFDFACQTEIENPREEKYENLRQIITKDQSIKIIEQLDRSDNSKGKRDQGQQILSRQKIQYSSQQRSKSKQNDNQSPQNIRDQQQQNEQLNIQQPSIEINHYLKAGKQKKFDEIRDKEGKIKVQLKRFKLILFQNGVRQQSKKNERFEKDYQNSLDNENRNFAIFESSFPIIKFNQQIGLKDKNILLNSKQFLTSSIINAYSNYLQAKDEHYYFSLNKNERIKHKRLFIFNSDFLTNCNLDQYKFISQNNEKAFFLLLQYLQDFKVIQYQFWLIYQKIAFIVNSNNAHWYLAVLDFKDGCLKIYDSLPKHPNYYNSLNYLLSQLFSQLSQRRVKFDTFVCPTWNVQQDHYSCGYHTCIALESLSQYVANSECLTLEEIKNILKKLLINEENEHNQQLNQ